MTATRLKYLSLFVPDLDRAATTYREVFAVEPEPASTPVLTAHPCSPRPPVVFDLGGVKLALYQQDGRTTHAGDVGIGLVAAGSLDELNARVVRQGGRTFIGPGPYGVGGEELAVFVLPDRHFFEVLSQPCARGEDSGAHEPRRDE